MTFWPEASLLLPDLLLGSPGRLSDRLPAVRGESRASTETVRRSLGARLTRRESGGISERIPTGPQRRAKRSAGMPSPVECRTTRPRTAKIGRFGTAARNASGSDVRVGAVAQLGARVNGIHEVTGSIPVSSTGCRRGIREAHGVWRPPADFKSVDSGLAPGMVGSIPTRFRLAARSRRGAWAVAPPPWMP